MVWNPPLTTTGLPKRVWDFAHTMKLALVLLLLCAGVAALGAFMPAEQAGRFYRSPPFVMLMGLLAVNVSLCSWRRFRARSTHAARHGWPLICSDFILHISIVCILAGGAGKALWGFTGTQYLFVGVETATVYDWRTRADVPLGFTLLAKERVEDYYPLQLKVGIQDAAGNKIALLDVAEGRPAELPGGSMKLSLLDYAAEAGTVRLAADRDGRREAATLGVSEGSPAVPLGGYTAAAVAWRRELKMVRARVAVLDGGREVKQEWLATNERVAYRGTSVFLTGWGRDEFGNLYVGIQVSRDPAAPLFWAGCILFSLSSVVFFYLRQRGRRSE